MKNQEKIRPGTIPDYIKTLTDLHPDGIEEIFTLGCCSHHSIPAYKAHRYAVEQHGANVDMLASIDAFYSPETNFDSSRAIRN